MADKKKTEITIHSSAAEYLTFVAATGDCESSYEMRYENENIWLTQKMMAVLYDVSVAAISQHIKRIYEDGELMPEATIKKYLTVQSEGARQVSRNLDHYNLRMIILTVSYSISVKSACQSGNFIKKLLTCMQQPLIMIKTPKLLGCFFKRFRIRCTLPFTGIPRRNSL